MRTGAAVQVLLALSLAARAGGQATTTPTDTAKPTASGFATGFVLGMPGSGGQFIPQLFTAGVSFTQVRPNHVGADISVGTMPYILAFGALPVGLRVGVDLPVSVVPHVLLIPTAGMSFIGAISPGGGGGLAGVNAGGSAVFYVSRMGLKTSLTMHHFADEPEPVWLFEFGVVSLPAGLP